MSTEVDVSALKAEIEALNLRLEHKNQATYAFIARMAHELKAPLGALLMWTHVLRMGRQADRETALDAIDASARAQSKIIGGLLDVTRAVAGRLRIERLRVDLTEVVRAAVEGLRPLAVARGQAVNFTSEGGASGVSGDAVRIREMVTNLVDNAIKFTPDGGKINVALTKTDDGLARITVRDTGRGFSADQLPTMFTALESPAVEARGAAGGLGLGLAFVRLVAELHDGTVSGHSEGEGRGATFCLDLPLERLD